MNIFGKLLRSMFGGEVTVRFVGETEDGAQVAGKATLEYFNADKSDAEAYLKKALYVCYGRRIKTLTITEVI